MTFCLQTALVVEVAGGTESPVTVTFTPFEPGDAPVRIDNYCEDVFLKMHQKLVFLFTGHCIATIISHIIILIYTDQSVG